jgi:hypothetical protein
MIVTVVAALQEPVLAGMPLVPFGAPHDEGAHL